MEKTDSIQLKQILQFLIGLFCIWMLIWIITPLLLPQTEVMEMIQEKEMNTSALFYTDSEEAVEANFEMMREKR